MESLHLTKHPPEQSGGSQSELGELLASSSVVLPLLKQQVSSSHNHAGSPLFHAEFLHYFLLHFNKNTLVQAHRCQRLNKSFV